MKKNFKPVALLLAAGLLVGGITVGATSAYMVDNEAKTNTFIVGEVQIDQSEPGFLENTKPMQPHEEIVKDPIIENTGKNDAIVFMAVEIPVEEVTLVGANGTKADDAHATELFWIKTSSTGTSEHKNSWDENWIKLNEKSSESTQAGEPSVYVFAYNKILKVNEKTTPLFGKVQLKSFLEGEIASNAAQLINVKSYAIQAAEILKDGKDLTDAFDSDDADETTLETIYDIFINQTSSY